ncbi:MAG: TIGR01212 family radical SAM protein [Erysipelotrichaceae bacterium]
MFEYSDTNKRYHTYSYYLKQKYQTKVAKLSFDGGYTCNNRDGSKGFGGCIFCGGKLVKGYDVDTIDFASQYLNAKKIMDRKWPNLKYIAYLQNFSNTYRPFEDNVKIYERVISFKDIVGLNIATRCDCIDDDTLNYLDYLCDKVDVTLELGLQSSFNQTLQDCNINYTYEDFLLAYERIKRTRVKLVVHLINGLPNETVDMMLETAKKLSKLDIDGVKIHMLHIMYDTILYKRYLNCPFPLLTLGEYCQLVVDQIRLFKPEVVIHRLTGDSIKEYLHEPKWTLNKTNVLNSIDKLMVKLDCFQGDKYEL